MKEEVMPIPFPHWPRLEGLGKMPSSQHCAWHLTCPKASYFPFPFPPAHFQYENRDKRHICVFYNTKKNSQKREVEGNDLALWQWAAPRDSVSPPLSWLLRAYGVCAPPSSRPPWLNHSRAGEERRALQPRRKQKLPLSDYLQGFPISVCGYPGFQPCIEKSLHGDSVAFIWLLFLLNSALMESGMLTTLLPSMTSHK